jgi:hypothetical protein
MTPSNAEVQTHNIPGEGRTALRQGVSVSRSAGQIMRTKPKGALCEPSNP